MTLDTHSAHPQQKKNPQNQERMGKKLKTAAFPTVENRTVLEVRIL